MFVLVLGLALTVEREDFIMSGDVVVAWGAFALSGTPEGGEPITFNAGGSYDPDGALVEYAWDWDWTGQFEGSDKPKTQHTWNGLFSGTVLLRVTDDEGNSSQKAVSVVVGPPEE